jgi:phosphoglycolate phosphatase-like HAD superfamily hydrolase
MRGWRIYSLSCARSTSDTDWLSTHSRSRPFRRSEHCLPSAGVPDTLCELYESGIVLVATTNAPLHQAIRRLERLDVATWFAGIAARCSFAGPTSSRLPVTAMAHSCSGYAPIDHRWQFDPPDLKPSDRMYRHALLATNTQPANALVVGDSLANDLVPALGLGARGAWARYGLHVDTGLWETLLAVTP